MKIRYSFKLRRSTNWLTVIMVRLCVNSCYVVAVGLSVAGVVLFRGNKVTFCERYMNVRASYDVIPVLIAPRNDHQTD